MSESGTPIVTDPGVGRARESRAGAGRIRQSSAWRDLLVIVTVSIAAWLLADWLELFERLDRLLARTEQSELNELLVMGFIAAVALAAFSLRRWHELRVAVAARRRVEQTLQESEDRYHSLFEDSPISIWEEDFSGVKEYIDDLRRRGVADLRAYFEGNADEVAACAARVKILSVNRATVTLFKAQSKADLLQSMSRLFTVESFPVFREELITLSEGGTDFTGEAVLTTLLGESIFVGLRLSIAPGHERVWSRVLVSIDDRTASKRAQDSVLRYADRLGLLHEIDRAMLSQQSPEAIACTALRRIRQLVASIRASVVVFDWESAEAVIVAVDPADTSIGAGARVPLALFGDLEALRQGQGRLNLVSDAAELAPQTPWIATLCAEGVRSYVNVPLIARGQLVGSLNLAQDVPGTFPEEHLEVAREVADSLAAAMQQARDLAALQDSERRFRTLFDDSPLSLWEEDCSALKARLDELRSAGIVDIKSHLAEHHDELVRCVSSIRIIDVNRTTLRLHGAASKEELLGSLERVAGEGAWGFLRESIAAVAGGRTDFEAEAVDRTLSGAAIDVLIRWHAMAGHERDYSRVLVSTIDISERKRAEEALRQYRERLELLYGLSRDLAATSLDPRATAGRALATLRDAVRGVRGSVLVFDEQGERMRVEASVGADSPALAVVESQWRRIPGLGMAGWVAERREAVCIADVCRDPRWRHVAGVGEWVRSLLGVPLVSHEELVGVIIITSDREDAFTDDHLRLVVAAAGTVATAIANARLFESVRRHREELRTLGSRLATAQEHERHQIARELHDRVGQELTGLSINLSIARGQLAAGAFDAVRSRLDDALTQVEATMERIRDVMGELRPPLLDDYGLVAALHWYGEQFLLRTGIRVEVSGSEPEPALAPDVVTAFFRIAQEALTNVARHSGATTATVTVHGEGDRTRLTVADDGVGFELSEQEGGETRIGWGLVGMRERAEAVGAAVRVVSSRGCGTQVMVEKAG